VFVCTVEPHLQVAARKDIIGINELPQT
jgi:hypothetical protein